jgi:hypothetical protein
VRAFGPAAVVTAALAGNALVEGGLHAGAGQWLSAALIAASAAVVFAAALLRSLQPAEV